MAKVSTGAAAEALGKNRKTLQRWAKKPGCPLGADGLVDVEELRAWAVAAGLMERSQESGPRTGVERALAEAAEVAPAAPEVRKAAAAVERIEVTGEAAKLLEALEADDRVALLRQGLGADPKLLKRLEAMGKARKELADAIRVELANQARRRELLPAAEVRRFWSGQIELVKGHFQALPGKLGPKLVGRTIDEVMATIEDELRSLLKQFAAEAPR
jgi:putative ubiquitin-RnfH superfamily antitoxin RatB of RatAB toxin-antitoxin module